MTERCLTFGMVRLSNSGVSLVYYCSFGGAMFWSKPISPSNTSIVVCVYSVCIDEQVGGQNRLVHVSRHLGSSHLKVWTARESNSLVGGF